LLGKVLKIKMKKILLDEILVLDKERREILQLAEELKAKRNKVSQEIGKLKKAGEMLMM
jgi:seryl-tRNA synthetase